ncbi:hypothetical protein LIER_40584 [Lithospermum erythrorhizon]|uniref:CCHC-type domain-containing protein n=1 Tax=Lithospermum erythrorhizon TaxID=34254 RepID=A0AAV3QYZ6_LITER
MIERGYIPPLEGTLLSENQQALLDEARLQDHQVKHYLFQALDRTTFEQILDRSTSKGVWDSLKKQYGGNEKVQKYVRNAWRKEFEVLEMKKGESIESYFARVTAIFNKLRSNGEEMNNSKINEKILKMLTDQFTDVVVSIEEARNINSMTVDDLGSTLVMHEQKFNRKGEEKEDHVLKVEERSYVRGRGHGTFCGRGKGRQGLNKATIECYKCHNLGHFQYECPKWNKEANYASVEKEDDMLLMAQTNGEVLRDKKMWFIDSGCSNHMCNEEGMFTNLGKDFAHFVKPGYNTRMEVAGKGDVKIFLNGLNYTITDVYYVPDLKNNLLSVDQLQERGLTILLKGKVCSITIQKGAW